MKIGIIDIGTNSVRLFIPNKDNIIKSKKYMEITRIGEGVDKNSELSEVAINRTIEGIKKLAAICDENGIDEIIAMATSAVRDAVNRDVFIERVLKETGIEVKVLSGDEEAELGLIGAIQGLSDNSGDSYLIVDIGGGSTELIEYKNGHIVKAKSFNIGAVRLTEKFNLSDPPSEEEINEMRQYSRNMIASFLKGVKGRLIGIGGTITTISAIENKVQVYDREKIHGSLIKKENIDDLFYRLIKLTNLERKNVVGLDELRSDIINAGMLILLCIIELMDADDIIVSDFDNLEGYYFKKNNVDKEG
ncbi:MAG: Ppx/GppA family phosphatase [Clostridiales bacterium]|nr:Ppx/GppA family phosphatase [Clostridiales bacterium]